MLILVGAAPNTAANPAPVLVGVLFDLGDGTFAWSYVTIEKPDATNASWNATLAAAAAHNITVNSTWFDCCGLAVTDLADRHAPTWPALLLWNRTSHVWEGAPVG